MKKCKGCGQEKVLEEFYNRASRCKVCTREKSKLRNKLSHPRRVPAKDRPEAYLDYKYKYLARQCKYRNVELGLTREQYKEIIEQGCYYCGHSILEDGGISLDRKNNYKNKYTIDNVLPSCHICNLTRSSCFTINEMERLGEVIHSIRKEREETGKEPLAIYKRKKCKT